MSDEIKEASEEAAPEEKKDITNLTDDEIDQIADCAIETLQDILKHFNLGEITIDDTKVMKVNSSSISPARTWRC